MEEVKRKKISQPYYICKDIKKLNEELAILSELPREAADLLLNYFEDEDAKTELDILASNLRAYKHSSPSSKNK